VATLVAVGATGAACATCGGTVAAFWRNGAQNTSAVKMLVAAWSGQAISRNPFWRLLHSREKVLDDASGPAHRFCLPWIQDAETVPKTVRKSVQTIEKQREKPRRALKFRTEFRMFGTCLAVCTLQPAKRRSS
jgi:hypothetical protein